MLRIVTFIALMSSTCLFAGCSGKKDDSADSDGQEQSGSGDQGAGQNSEPTGANQSATSESGVTRNMGDDVGRQANGRSDSEPRLTTSTDLDLSAEAWQSDGLLTMGGRQAIQPMVVRLTLNGEFADRATAIGEFVVDEATTDQGEPLTLYGTDPRLGEEAPLADVDGFLEVKRRRALGPFGEQPPSGLMIKLIFEKPARAFRSIGEVSGTWRVHAPDADDILEFGDVDEMMARGADDPFLLESPRLRELGVESLEAFAIDNTLNITRRGGGEDLIASVQVLTADGENLVSGSGGFSTGDMSQHQYSLTGSPDSEGRLRIMLDSNGETREVPIRIENFPLGEEPDFFN